ncbi:MAG: hypothetical protein LQ351_000320 [Letrouitia transgressa]|nr:MAG: hypothetical protein LQ351_000320 [Letrouitia transgressa]
MAIRCDDGTAVAKENDIHNYDLYLQNAFTAAQFALGHSALSQPEQDDWNVTCAANFHVSLAVMLLDPLKRKDDSDAVLPPHPDAKRPRLASTGTGHLNFSLPTPRNKGGRPPKQKVDKPKELSSLPTLRSNKQVKAEIPLDIWDHVFRFSPLAFLTRARTISRGFRRRLAYEATWRAARMYNYGPDHPPPPPGLTEQQYADLLVGTGCQNRGCNDKKARKTYWAFQRRWCDSCLKKNVIMKIGCSSILEKFPRILEIVPHVRFDSWGHYQWVGDYPDHPSWQKSDEFQKTAFLRSDVTKAIRAIEEAGESTANGVTRPEDEMESWFQARKAANEELVCHLQQIENWVETSKRDKLVASAEFRHQRIDFFREKAAAMDPPVSAELLDRMPSYGRAIAISSKPTENAWRTLMPKLERERAEAQIELLKLNRPVDQHFIDAYQWLEYERKKENRYEQRYVLDLADAVISQLVKSEKERTLTVAEADFVHLSFRNFYAAYEATPDICKPDASEGGKYRLLMDDVRMIYEKRLKPFMQGWKEERIRAATLVRCPICPVKDGPPTHQDLFKVFQHVFERHAPKMPEFRDFHVPRDKLPPEVAFPWCGIQWPRNLPMLPLHHRVTGKWDLHSPMKYECEPEHADGASLFQNRSASRHPNSPSPLNFVDNVFYALAQLEHTDLPDKFKTSMVSEYALLKYWERCERHPEEDVLAELQLGLVRRGVKGVFEGFRCRACCEQAKREGRTNNKFIARGKPFGELVQHYFATHRDPWPEKMMDLPAPEALMAALREPGHEAALAAFERLFPLNEDADIDPQLQGCGVLKMGSM